VRSDSAMTSGDGTTSMEEKGSKALMVAVTSGIAGGHVSKHSTCTRVSSGEGEGAASTHGGEDRMMRKATTHRCTTQERRISSLDGGQSLCNTPRASAQETAPVCMHLSPPCVCIFSIGSEHSHNSPRVVLKFPAAIIISTHDFLIDQGSSRPRDDLGCSHLGDTMRRPRLEAKRASSP
jgi:hypothetical protein